MVCFFFQAEDCIRDLVRSRGLGDVYKRQGLQLVGGDFGGGDAGGGLIDDALLFGCGGDEGLDCEVVHRSWEAS